MLDVVAQFQGDTDESLTMRIGINTGPVVAGVIGTNKFIYDLWGDTVNIASRMESFGLPGCIQVSSTTYKILQNKYSFKERGSIPIKGKGGDDHLSPYRPKNRLTFFK
jgi:class 3 adenylate cyclase